MLLNIFTYIRLMRNYIWHGYLDMFLKVFLYIYTDLFSLVLRDLGNVDFITYCKFLVFLISSLRSRIFDSLSQPKSNIYFWRGCDQVCCNYVWLDELGKKIPFSPQFPPVCCFRTCWTIEPRHFRMSCLITYIAEDKTRT